MTIPFPSPEELDRVYAADYGYGAHQIIEAEKRWRSRGLLDFADVSRGRVLDVGCMFGFLLDEAKERGAETWGVEIAGPPAEMAAQNGHRIAAKTIEELSDTPKFDAIFAQHVLEHIREPGPFLDKARELLTDDGQLVLAVPNLAARARRAAKKAWAWYQVPVHVFHYEEGSLRRLLEEHGLRVTKVGTRSGDTLFMALTAMQSAGIIPKRGGHGEPSKLTKGVFRVLGEATKPIVGALDDELMIVARRA